MNTEILTKKTESSVHFKAVIFLIITAMLWSSGGLLIKSVTWNPVAIAGGRSLISAILLYFIICREKIQWSKTLIYGAFAYAGTVIFFVAANKMTTAANAILLQYTAPIYVAIFGAWLLKERVKVLDWIVIFCVIAGMLLFFMDDLEAGGLLGNILALISGICFASMILLLRAQKDASPLQSVFLGNVLTAIIGLPFMITGGLPDSKSILGLVVLGVFQLGLAYIFYSYAIKHVTALEGVLIPIIEPILNPVWVIIFLGEIPGFWAIIGGIIVIGAISARGIIYSLKTNKAFN
jgi:drug/metabolite transporter (DMT)-like permease